MRDETLLVVIRGVPYRRVPHWCNGKSLERGGSYTEEMVLCSGLLVDDDRAGLSQRDMKPCFIIISQYPTSWAYNRNTQPHQHTHTTKLVGYTKYLAGDFEAHPLTNKHPSRCNLHRILLVDNLAFHAFIPSYSPSGYMRLTKYPNFFFRSYFRSYP